MSATSSHRSALPAGYALHWYSIEKVLGRGGFGITYLASDNNLGHTVAIKEFLPTDLAYRTSDNTVQALSEEHVETYQWGLGRFLVEARTLARFRHPNIVLVHSVFEANNTAYIVMQYETGSSLEQAYAAGGINTESQLTSLLLSLMDGVECMHNEGFVHRDIKPSNIYLRDHNHPVLLDFGSARQALGMETRTMTTMVSPGYAPFEQYNANRENDSQGPWTDIYALGSTIYRGIAGKDPSDALSLANDRIKGVQEVTDPATQIGRGRYSDQFLHAIDIAMRFNANERPQTIGHWRDILQGKNQVSPDAVTIVSPPTGMKPQTGPTSQVPGQFNTSPLSAQPPQVTQGNSSIAQPGAGQHWQSPPNTGPAVNPDPNHSGPVNTGQINTGQINTGQVHTGQAHPAPMPAQPPNSGAWNTGPAVNEYGHTGNASYNNAQAPQMGMPDSPPAQAVITQTPEAVAPKKNGILLPLLITTTAVAVAGIFYLLGRDGGVSDSTSTASNDVVEQIQPAEENVAADTAAKAQNTLAELKDLTSANCTALSVSEDGKVSGYATTNAISAIESVAATLPTPPVADFTNTEVFPAVFCEPINALGGYKTLNGDLQIDTTLPKYGLIEGDRLVMQMQSGIYNDNNFYVDYFSLDGNVVHLLSSNSEQTNKAKQNEVLILGEPGGIERWDIAAPFGEEMISLIVSDKPLAMAERPEIESAAAYLTALADAIDANGTRVSSSLLKIKTQPGQ